MLLSEIYRDNADTSIHKYYDTVDDAIDDLAITKDARDEIKRAARKANHKSLGIGAYAYVGTDDDENFGDVARYAHVQDGGSLYLQFIANHPAIAENPFFPRVQRTKAIGQQGQVSIVERLIPMKEPAVASVELLTAVCKRLFKVPPSASSTPIQIIRHMCKFISQGIRIGISLKLS